jgi:hypothetical protein
MNEAIKGGWPTNRIMLLSLGLLGVLAACQPPAEPKATELKETPVVAPEPNKMAGDVRKDLVGIWKLSTGKDALDLQETGRLVSKSAERTEEGLWLATDTEVTFRFEPTGKEPYVTKYTYKLKGSELTLTSHKVTLKYKR